MLQTMDIDAKDITTGCKQLVLSLDTTMRVHLALVHDFSVKHVRLLDFFLSNKHGETLAK